MYIVSNKNSTVGGPTVVYTASISMAARTANTATFSVSVSGRLSSSAGYLGSGYPLKPTVYVGGKQLTLTLKSDSQSWSGTGTHTVSGTLVVDGLAPSTTSLSTAFSVSAKSTSSAGYLAKVSGPTASIPAYNVNKVIYKKENAEETETKEVESLIVQDGTIFEKPTYSFHSWINEETAMEVEIGSTVENGTTLYATWDPVYLAPNITGFNAFRTSEGSQITFSIDGGQHISQIDVNKIVATASSGDETYDYIMSHVGSDYTGQYTGISDAHLNTETQYKVSVSIFVKTDFSTELQELKLNTFISTAGVIIDVNQTGTAVGFGYDSPDNDDNDWIDKGIYIAKDWDIYLRPTEDDGEDISIREIIKKIQDSIKWKKLSEQRGTIATSFNTEDYQEVLVYAEIERNSAFHYYSAVMPVEKLRDNPYEIKLSGGYGSSGVYTLIQVKISKTSAQLNSAHINGENFASATTVTIYAR